MSPAIALHYTIGTHIASIREAGELWAATDFVPAGEIPIVWFSTRQHWEPTANKALICGGQRIGLTFKETIEARFRRLAVRCTN